MTEKFVPKVSDEIEAPDDWPFSVRSFQEAETRTSPLSDKFVEGVLTEPTAKGFLDQAEVATTDQEFLRNPELIFSLHEKTARMIISNLRIFVSGLGDRQISYVESREQHYKQAIEASQSGMRRYIDKWCKWRTQDKEKRHASNPPKRPFYAKLSGLTVESNTGKVDILEQPIRGKDELVESNIKIQDQIFGQFILWDTKDLVIAKRAERMKPLTRRIYLNPDWEAGPEIFAEIMNLCDEIDLQVRGKIFEYKNEAMRNLGEDQAKVRADQIVLYSSEDQCDILLEVVAMVYDAHRQNFANRPMPKVPMRIADGVAIGDEPTEGSLTSHRAEVLEDVRAKTFDAIGRPSWDSFRPEEDLTRATSTFRQIFEQEAGEAGINPDNIAFNRQPQGKNVG